MALLFIGYLPIRTTIDRYGGGRAGTQVCAFFRDGESKNHLAKVIEVTVTMLINALGWDCFCGEIEQIFLTIRAILNH